MERYLLCWKELVDQVQSTAREPRSPRGFRGPRGCRGPGHSRRNRSCLFQVVLDHCGCTPRGVMGVKWPEILWEIQKYSLPGRPSSQNWVKSKTICHFWRNFDEFLNGFWFYSILAEWSTWQWVFSNFSQNFWSFDTPDTPGCASAVIWNHYLKQILAIPPTVYSLLRMKEILLKKFLSYLHVSKNQQEQRNHRYSILDK